MQKKNNDFEKYKLMSELSKHIGRNRAIGMVDLYTRVYDEQPKSRHSGTRKIRALVTELRKEGVPICSTQDKEGGGYYMASAGSELQDYCGRLRTRALKLLAQEAKLKRVALPELLGEIRLNLESVDVVNE